MGKKKYIYENVKLIKVINRSLIKVSIDLGFDIWKVVEIKLFGANVPDLNSNNFSERKKAIELKEKLENILVPNEDKLRIEIFRYTNNECLSIVYVNNKMLNDLI